MPAFLQANPELPYPEMHYNQGLNFRKKALYEHAMVERAQHVHLEEPVEYESVEHE